MIGDHDLRISVTASWKDWRCASVRAADLQNVHWHQPAGAPHALLHADLLCEGSAREDTLHVCDGLTPHQLRVCVLKSHNIPSVYAELARQASRPVAVPCSLPGPQNGHSPMSQRR